MGGVSLKEPIERPHKGAKHDTGKARWDLLPWEAVREVVNVMTDVVVEGRYLPDSWRDVPAARRRYFAALHRHLDARLQGERYDQHSQAKRLTLAHAACDALFLLALDLLPDAPTTGEEWLEPHPPAESV